MRFRALATFESEETRSTYVEGLTYTVRPGNDLLAVLAVDWAEQDKIEFIDSAVVPKSRISGSGFVK
jgi:hypothetical protein